MLISSKVATDRLIVKKIKKRPARLPVKGRVAQDDLPDGSESNNHFNVQYENDYINNEKNLLTIIMIMIHNLNTTQINYGY